MANLNSDFLSSDVRVRQTNSSPNSSPVSFSSGLPPGILHAIQMESRLSLNNAVPVILKRYQPTSKSVITGNSTPQGVSKAVLTATFIFTLFSRRNSSRFYS